MMNDTSGCIYEFGPFRLDAAERLLIRDGGEPLTLQPKEFDLLLFLVRRGARVADRDEIIKEVWGDAFVVPGRVDSTVSDLRKLLGDQARDAAYIETVQKSGERFKGGYRFIADVREVAVYERTRTHVVIEEETPDPLHAPGAAAAFIPAPPAESSDAGGNLAVAAAEPAPAALPPAPASSAPRRLRFYRLALAVALSCAFAFGAWYALKGRGAAAPRTHSVAVLPFKPLVPSESDPALELGITDALITKLANVRQIAVRPTNSVLKYAGEGRDLRAVGEELGVDVLLDGRVQKAGDRIRLSVQLVRVGEEAPIWADAFEARLTDIFDVQDRISREVVSKLALQLTGAESRGLAKRYTQDPEAYQLYLKGLYHWRTFKQEGLLTSLNFYNAAIEKDPRYALAYSGLANAYTVIGIYGPLPAAESMERAREAARRAVELDDTLAEGHAALGGNKIFYEWDWPGAERELKRARELAGPESVNGSSLYGYYLWAAGRQDEAVEELRRAAEVAPQWQVPAHDYVESLYVARRYGEAIARCREGLRLEPDEPFLLYILGRSHMMEGRREEAIAEFERGLRAVEGRGQDPDTRVWLLSGLGYAHALAGRRDEALQAVARMRESQSRVKTLYTAMVWAGLGDRDQAFALLDEAYRERQPFLWQVRVLPEFDPLRSDLRYAELLKRMNLAP